MNADQRIRALIIIGATLSILLIAAGVIVDRVERDGLSRITVEER